MENRSGQLIAKNDIYILDLLTDDRYEINPDGTIRTIITTTGKISTQGVWRNAIRLKNEYQQISYTTQAGKRINLSVHRIMYAKFIDKLEADLVINHINGVKSDNSLVNLELDTQGHNTKHRFRVLKTGAVIGNKKISDETADQIRLDHQSGLSFNKLAEKYSMAKSSISYIINRKTWDRTEDSGYKFEYKTKLTLDLARQMRADSQSGLSTAELMQKYGVKKTTVLTVISGKTWKEPKND